MPSTRPGALRKTPSATRYGTTGRPTAATSSLTPQSPTGLARERRQTSIRPRPLFCAVARIQVERADTTTFVSVATTTALDNTVARCDTQHGTHGQMTRQPGSYSSYSFIEAYSANRTAKSCGYNGDVIRINDRQRCAGLFRKT
jgi:hypothetical protein